MIEKFEQYWNFVTEISTQKPPLDPQFFAPPFCTSRQIKEESNKLIDTNTHDISPEVHATKHRWHRQHHKRPWQKPISRRRRRTPSEVRWRACPRLRARGSIPPCAPASSLLEGPSLQLKTSPARSIWLELSRCPRRKWPGPTSGSDLRNIPAIARKVVVVRANKRLIDLTTCAVRR